MFESGIYKVSFCKSVFGLKDNFVINGNVIEIYFLFKPFYWIVISKNYVK